MTKELNRRIAVWSIGGPVFATISGSTLASKLLAGQPVSVWLPAVMVYAAAVSVIWYYIARGIILKQAKRKS